MENKNEFTVDTAVNAEVTQVEAPQGIQLSDEEKALIETQRQESAKLNAFREGYQRLVQDTGFAWAVDLQSPLGAPKLGVTRINR